MISAVLASQRQLRGLIIGCDRTQRGTNLLAFDADCMPRFSFGVDSCSAHLASAHSAGIPVQILSRLGIGVDVDEAQDLKCALEHLHLVPQGATSRLLSNTALGARVTLALATLANDRGSGKSMGDMNEGKAN